MPEVWFTLRWPDESEERCYSPSTIISQHLTAGTTYSLDDFSMRATTALQSASSRVEEKYGYPCSRAMGQLARIEQRVSQFQQQPNSTVTCLDLSS